MKPRGLASLGAAQAVALLAAVLSGAVYARWLDAPTLAGWALALAAARAAQLLVDGGIKTALVRREFELSASATVRLQRLVAAAALALGTAVVLALLWAVDTSRLAPPVAALVGVAVAAYLGSHVALLAGLVRLEREGRFDGVGQAEGLGTAIEFALPALLMATGVQVWTALAIGVVIGRGWRAGAVAWAARRLPGTPPADTPGRPAGMPLWHDAAAVQGVALLSIGRDNLHLWLVGPWFGSAWAGAYAFALLACAIASQVLVATVARVALPALRPLSAARRAVRSARALRRLALVTLPLLALTLPLLTLADRWVWDGRWQTALEVLPGLLVRMVLGLPLAVLGPWLMVAAPAARVARVHARWTALDLALAVAALALLGPSGLALSWAIGGAVGTACVAAALRPHGLHLFGAALCRPRARGIRPRLQAWSRPV